MQIVPFLPHYQLVYINFDFSSFSLISYILKAALLRRKTMSFTMQKSRFRITKQQILQYADK